MSTIDRREFFKVAGAGSVALGAMAMGCTPAQQSGSKTSTGEMEMRVHPKDNDKVSLLGYGCMRWPVIEDEQGNKVIDQKQVNELVDKALAEGVNYFDTAPVYHGGKSEEATGIALSRHPRESYHIATKLSNSSVFTKEFAMNMLNNSFKYLQTDYIDYYLLHNIGRGGVERFNLRFVDNGVIDELLKLREEGRIRHLGFSFHGAQEEFDELIKLHDVYHFDFVMIQMNYLDWRHAEQGVNVDAEYLYHELDKRNIPITVMEPLQGGRLVNLPENVAALLKEKDPDASLPSWAFRFVGSHKRILTTLSGMTYMEHLLDNLNTFKGFKYLTEQEENFLIQMAVLMAEFPMVKCNYCEYCVPCPYGVNIPGIFRYYNNSISDGMLPQNEEQENFKKLKRQYLTKYNKSIQTLAQANHCIECGKCLEKCPQRIAIPKELRRIDLHIEKLKRAQE